MVEILILILKFHFRAVFEARGGLPVVVDPIEAVGLEPTTGAPSAESNSDTKKVSYTFILVKFCMN